MKKLIEPYKKILIVLSFPYLYLLMVLTIPTGFEGIGPGGLTPVSEAIHISDATVADISTVYVLSYEPLTPLQSWLMMGHDEMAVYPRTAFSKTLTMKDQYERGQLSKRLSFTYALIAGYEEAMKSQDHLVIDYVFNGLVIDYRPKNITELEIGDRVIGINGHNYQDYEPDDFLALAATDTMTLTIQRMEKTIEYEYERGSDLYRLHLVKDYTISNAVPTYQLPGLDRLYGGPSGGAMQALSIVVSLVGLNLENRRIAGTGTIETDGSIGRIGGLEQKLITAEDHDIDVFFIPFSHQGEVTDLDRFSFEIVYVNTLTDVISVIGEWHEDAS